MPKQFKSSKGAVHAWAGSCYQGPLEAAGCDLGAPERGKGRPYATQRTSEYDWSTKNTLGSRIIVTVRIRTDTEREGDRLGALVLENLTAPSRPAIPAPLYVSSQEEPQCDTTEIPQEGGQSYFTTRAQLTLYIGRTDD